MRNTDIKTERQRERVTGIQYTLPHTHTHSREQDKKDII